MTSGRCRRRRASDTSSPLEHTWKPDLLACRRPTAHHVEEPFWEETIG
jgi:hypothetical protein